MTDNGSITLDLDALTLGDLQDFKKAAGESLFPWLRKFAQSQKKAEDELKEGKVDEDEFGLAILEAMSEEALLAFFWIAKRQQDSSFTLEQAQAMPVLAGIDAMNVVGGGTPDPTTAAS